MLQVVKLTYNRITQLINACLIREWQFCSWNWIQICRKFVMFSPCLFTQFDFMGQTSIGLLRLPNIIIGFFIGHCLFTLFIYGALFFGPSLRMICKSSLYARRKGWFHAIELCLKSICKFNCSMQHFVKLLKYSRCLYADTLDIYTITCTVSALKYIWIYAYIQKKILSFLFAKWIEYCRRPFDLRTQTECRKWTK